MTYSTSVADVFAPMFRHAPDFVSVSDAEGRVHYVNPAGSALIGLRWDATQNLCIDDVFTAVGARPGPKLAGFVRDVATWTGDATLLHLVTQERIPVSTSAFVINGTGDDQPMIASIHRDLRDRRSHDQQLQNALDSSAFRVSEQRVVAELSQLALRGRLDELLASAADAAVELMGARCAFVTRLHTAPATLETVAQSGSFLPFGNLPPALDSLPGYAIEVNRAVVCSDPATEARFSADILAAHGLPNGVAVPIAGTGRAWGALTVFGTTNNAVATGDLSVLDTMADILSAAIRRVDLEAELRYRSLRDPLTGLPNRALAYDRIDSAIERRAGRATHTAVMLIDLDDFKSINDSLGHEAGDAALIGLAQRLARAARAGDTVARLGGDEFVAVCENIEDPQECYAMADAFAEAVRAPIVLDGNELQITASIGIALADSAMAGAELIRRADVAMYRAKYSGPDNTAMFDTDDRDQARRQLALSTDLRGALDHNDLTLEYQPIFDIETGRITAVEALARWNHPTLGVVSPATFVPVAERTGLINSLGLWALRTACEQAAEWQAISDIGMRVNVSALQLRQPNFVAEVTAVLLNTKLPVGKLGLEITETVWLADTVQVRDALTELHALGVSILLDDLGSGHNSVTYLNRYPVIEAFKIDQAYIQAMPGRRPEAIVSAIVSLAHAFDVAVVGEGVETQTQLDRLRESGCDLAQGFLLAGPASASEVTSMLLERSAG
ncbi:EAL domain-containing protein [Actinomycetes bacterium M1A6_2h]